MKLAVMQPYLFPYIGYFQLIYAADLFLLYDDVNYIKRGYINRNSVLAANGVTRFTVPVPEASINKLISDLQFSKKVEKILKLIEHSYINAPYFESVFPLIQQVMKHEDRTIASICQNSYQTIFSYLGFDKKFRKTSEISYERSATAQDKLISLCHMLDADCYINASGGRSLYAKNDFAEQGVELKFIDSFPVEYWQGGREFVPNLSIIDVLMNCSTDESASLMKQYELN